MDSSASVAQLCPTLCDPMDYSTPGFPVHHQLPEFAMSIELVMPSNHLILCHPCLLPSIFPSIRVFSSGLVFISSGQSIIMVSGEISMSHYHHRVTIVQNSELKVLESFRSSESIRYCEIHNTYVSVTLIFSSFPHLCMEVPTQSPCLGPRLKGTLSSALIGGIQAGQAFRIPTETQSPVEP